MALIRPVLPEDDFHLTQLMAQVGDGLSRETCRRRIHQVGANPLHEMWVAEDEQGELVGWIHAQQLVSLLTDPVGEINGPFVAPSRRGCGLAKQLLAKAERWLTQQGLYSWQVRADQEESSMYEFYYSQEYQVCGKSLLLTKSAPKPKANVQVGLWRPQFSM